MTFYLAISILQRRRIRNDKPEVELCKFRDKKESHAQCIACEKKGSKGKNGSSLDESNHLSLLVFLNDSESQFNLYCEIQFTLVKDLFLSQQTHINKFNEVSHN